MLVVGYARWHPPGPTGPHGPRGPSGHAGVQLGNNGAQQGTDSGAPRGESGDTEDEKVGTLGEVGAGEDGEEFWIVKNSWSTSWGLDGYILVKAANNHCGILTCPTYVLVN